MSMSQLLTENEKAILYREGKFIIIQFIPHIAQGVAWGAYLFLAAFAINILCSKGIRDSRPRQVLLTVTIFMFLSSTVLMVQKIYALLGIYVKRIHFTGEISEESLDDKFIASEAEFVKTEIGAQLLFSFEFLLGDAVVIWRTWVLWVDKRIAMSAPILLWLGSFGTFLAWMIYVIVTGATGRFTYVAPLNTQLKLANFALSMLANLVATGMIAFKAWQHRRMIRVALGNTATATQKILALLIESGTVYILLWVVQLSLLVSVKHTYGPALIVLTTFGYMANQAVGLYPTIIIVLVELQRTIWDKEGSASGGRMPSSNLSDVRFASAHPSLSVVNVGEGQRQVHSIRLEDGEPVGGSGKDVV